MSGVEKIAAEVVNGDGLSQAQAAKILPAHRGTGKVSSSTVWRWITRGVRLTDGTTVKLGAVRIGTRWVTSKQAVERFIVALTGTQ